MTEEQTAILGARYVPQRRAKERIDEELIDGRQSNVEEEQAEAQTAQATRRPSLRRELQDRIPFNDRDDDHADGNVAKATRHAARPETVADGVSSRRRVERGGYANL